MKVAGIHVGYLDISETSAMLCPKKKAGWIMNDTEKEYITINKKQILHY